MYIYFDLEFWAFLLFLSAILGGESPDSTHEFGDSTATGGREIQLPGGGGGCQEVARNQLEIYRFTDWDP